MAVNPGYFRAHQKSEGSSFLLFLLRQVLSLEREIADNLTFLYSPRGLEWWVGSVGATHCLSDVGTVCRSKPVSSSATWELQRLPLKGLGRPPDQALLPAGYLRSLTLLTALVYLFKFGSFYCSICSFQLITDQVLLSPWGMGQAA